MLTLVQFALAYNAYDTAALGLHGVNALLIFTCGLCCARLADAPGPPTESEPEAVPRP